MLISGFLRNQSTWQSWASTHALLYQLEQSATCPLQEGLYSPDGSPGISLLYYLSGGARLLHVQLLQKTLSELPENGNTRLCKYSKADLNACLNGQYVCFRQLKPNLF